MMVVMMYGCVRKAVQFILVLYQAFNILHPY